MNECVQPHGPLQLWKIRGARRRWLGLAVLVMLGTVATHALAGPATDQVKATVDEVLGILEAPQYQGPAHKQARRKAIRRAVNERFEFDQMARRSLGIYWAQRTAAERSEFTRLYTDLLERSYINRIESYTGEQIRYLDETVDDDHAEVRTKIVTKGRDEIPVNYRLARQGDKWEVYDIVIEGVSLVNNYRSQMARIINQSSYDALIRRMRAAAAEDYGRPRPPGTRPTPADEVELGTP
jgi:phospholipid transport system substrate-binding protein